MKNKIKIWLVEYFNENDNCWEWGNIVRQSEYTKEQARKMSFADSFGDDYDKKEDKFITNDKEQLDFLEKNWEENTREWGLTI